LTIEHTCYPGDDEHFYFWDRGFDQWIEFDPTDIGFTADEVSKGAVYSIGAAGAIVGGLLILGNGAVINAARQGGKKVFVNSWKIFLIPIVILTAILIYRLLKEKKRQEGRE
jgi:hypothetical protein